MGKVFEQGENSHRAVTSARRPNDLDGWVKCIFKKYLLKMVKNYKIKLVLTKVFVFFKKNKNGKQNLKKTISTIF